MPYRIANPRCRPAGLRRTIPFGIEKPRIACFGTLAPVQIAVSEPPNHLEYLQRYAYHLCGANERSHNSVAVRLVGAVRELSMARNDDVTVIKKYANRRLYNTGTSTYVTLENLAAMVKSNEEFVVQDAKSGEDITHSVLTQIIFEQENKGGQNLMPIAFLRQLIRFYGDQMQVVIPGYLEQSMSALAKEQDAMREQMTGAMTQSPIKLIEAQVRRNTEMFRRAMTMFNPFVAGALTDADLEDSGGAHPNGDGGKNRDEDLKAMREQLQRMQERLEAIDAKKAE